VESYFCEEIGNRSMAMGYCLQKLHRFQWKVIFVKRLEIQACKWGTVCGSYIDSSGKLFFVKRLEIEACKWGTVCRSYIDSSGKLFL